MLLKKRNKTTRKFFEYLKRASSDVVQKLRIESWTPIIETFVDPGGQMYPLGNVSIDGTENATPAEQSAEEPAERGDKNQRPAIPAIGTVPIDPHWFTHLPARPDCEACRRGKSRDVRHFSNMTKREITEFGDIVTFDHLTFGSVCYDDANTPNTTKSLVILDIASNFTECVPVNTESSDNTVLALKEFLGDDIKRVKKVLL